MPCQQHRSLAGAGPCSHGQVDLAVVEGLRGAVVGPRAEDFADLVALRRASILSPQVTLNQSLWTLLDCPLMIDLMAVSKKSTHRQITIKSSWLCGAYDVLGGTEGDGCTGTGRTLMHERTPLHGLSVPGGRLAKELVSFADNKRS